MYYLSGSEDRAILLPHLPQPAGGSPLIVTSDIELWFAYPIAADFFQKNQPGQVSEAEAANSFVEIVQEGSFFSQGDVSEMYVVWDTGICPGHILRHYHRREDLRTHPLAEKGMSACAVYEVKPSAWLHHVQSTEPENLPPEIISQYHPATQTATVKHLTYHHLLFAFHGTTLELLTDRLSYELFQKVEQVRQEIQRIKWGADAYGS